MTANIRIESSIYKLQLVKHVRLGIMLYWIMDQKVAFCSGGGFVELLKLVRILCYYCLK